MMASQTVTITGTWTYPDGTPASGEVVFTPTTPTGAGWVNPGGPVAAAPIGVTLDHAGQISIDLPTPHIDDMWVWLVIERITGGRVAVYPLHLKGHKQSIDLGDVTPDADQQVWGPTWRHTCRCAPQWPSGWGWA